MKHAKRKNKRDGKMRESDANGFVFVRLGTGSDNCAK